MTTRAVAIAGAVIAIALGVGSRRFPVGAPIWDKSLGDVLYAVMMGFIALASRPSLSPRAVGAAAFSICFALELFQLTGIAWKLPRPLRFVLGTTFAWHDVACYLVGALAVTTACAIEARRRTRA